MRRISTMNLPTPSAPPAAIKVQRIPLLVVLDVNGTLLDRLTKTDEKKRARENPSCPSSPDYVVNTNRIYLRPYVDPFLDCLCAHFHVAFWTSATLKNARPMVESLAGHRSGSLEFIWDRRKCDEGKGYTTVKDLSRVWRSDFLDGKWTADNTILIDDTESKGKATPANILRIPIFSVGDHDCEADNHLLHIAQYLIKNIYSQPGVDVRKIMESNPFCEIASLSSSRLAEVVSILDSKELAPFIQAYSHRHRRIHESFVGAKYIQSDENGETTNWSWKDFSSLPPTPGSKGFAKTPVRTPTKTPSNKVDRNRGKGVLKTPVRVESADNDDLSVAMGKLGIKE